MMKLYRIFACFLMLMALQLDGGCAEFVSKKLPSGQLVIVNELKDNPIVTINTWVRTGSINENNENSGVAHFLEHLFFKGSKNVPTGEFDKILEAKGAITNAATSKDYTQFYITIPSKDFDIALKMHSDMLLSPLIPNDELEKERFVVIEEIQRGLDSPSNILYQNLFNLIYSQNKHPYCRPVIGYKEVIQNIKRDKILEFYNNWYTPFNMITVVSGDIDAKDALLKIEEAFKQEPKKHEAASYPAPPSIDKQLKINEEKDVAQGYMAIAYKAPKFIDSKEAYALDVLAIILGGSNSAILNSDLKENKELVNSISASYSQYMEDGLFIISSTFKPENLSKVKNEIFDNIEKTKNGKITKKQVEKAKAIIKTSTSFARESGANIASELGFFAFYYKDPKMYDEYTKRIDDVQLKDVNDALNKFLIKDKTAISTVMPKGFIEISNISAAAKIKPDGAKLIEKNDKEKKFLLDNGATLIIRKNKQNSIVAIDVLSKGGNFLEEKPTIGFLTANTIKRGTQNYSFDELTDFLDENGIELGFNAGYDAFSVSLLSAKNKLNDALSILDETVNRATFPTTELNKAKNNYKEYAKSLKDRPLSYAIDAFNYEAFKGYPYANTSKVNLSYIDEIQKSDLVKFYQNIFDSKNLVISVVGDVDEDRMIKEFNRIFEDKKQKSVEIKDFLKGSYVPEKNVQKKMSNSGKETSWILVAYKTAPVYNLKDMATLRVIDALLGTGMSSRLFKSLREEQGLAYQVGTQINQYANDASIFGYIGTNSKNEGQALKGIISEFDKLKTEFVSKTELDEAKEKLLGNMVLALETNMSKASFLSKYDTLGYDLNFLNKLQDEIKNVSQSDIISFANKYFSKPHFEIIVGK